jgi:hypothetical protein
VLHRATFHVLVLLQCRLGTGGSDDGREEMRSSDGKENTGSGMEGAGCLPDLLVRSYHPFAHKHSSPGGVKAVQTALVEDNLEASPPSSHRSPSPLLFTEPTHTVTAMPVDADAVRLQLNLSNLKRHDPHITAIVSSTSYASVYENRGEGWVRLLDTLGKRTKLTGSCERRRSKRELKGRCSCFQGALAGCSFSP